MIHPKKAQHAAVLKPHTAAKHGKHQTLVLRGSESRTVVLRGGEAGDYDSDLFNQLPAPRVPARAGASERFVSLVNAHTNEGIHTVYWRDGEYLPAAMSQVNRVMRDHMSGDVHRMDPRLVDLLGDLRQSVGSTDPWVLISGYRSPRTNAWLHRHSCGVAAHSLHVKGQAADIVLPGEDLGMLHNAALRLGEGGVGYYPRSGFVHVDTGKVREWEFE
jgi:uncharacterized protein YcbK (DUF882 family)